MTLITDKRDRESRIERVRERHVLTERDRERERERNLKDSENL